LCQAQYSKLKCLKAIPKKGDGKLKAALSSDDAKRLVKLGPLIAVFDLDKVRKCYNLNQNCCKKEIIEEIYKNSGLTTQNLTVVLLDSNVESLLACCCNILGLQVPIQKPDLNHRDQICAKMSKASDKLEILEKQMPSFARLVEKTLNLLI